MSKVRAKDEVLGELHIAVAEDLLAKIKEGTATPAEINAAIKFLANNHIEVNTVAGSPTERLANALPHFDDDDNEEATAH